MKREWFDRLAAAWDSLPGQPQTAARAETFLRKIVDSRHARILDAGAGTGVLVEPLLRLPEPPELIVELDFAPGMLAENRRKHGAHPQVRMVCGDICAPPFPAAFFDAVIVFSALPHIENKKGALEALLRVLRPGGRLAVGHLMGSEALNAMHATIGGAVAEDRLPPARELAALCEQLGAKVAAAAESAEEYRVVAEKPS